MGRETVPMRKITELCSSLQLERDTISMRAECLISCYHDVMWAKNSSILTARSANWNAAAALQFIAGFDPYRDIRSIHKAMLSQFQAKWLKELVGAALTHVESYPMILSDHREILNNTFSDMPMKDQDYQDKNNLGRTAFRNRKNEAVLLFGVALWGVVIPARLALGNLPDRTA